MHHFLEMKVVLNIHYQWIPWTIQQKKQAMRLHINVQYLLHPFLPISRLVTYVWKGHLLPSYPPHLVAKLQSRKVPSTLPDTRRSASQAALKQTTALQQALGVGWVVGWKQSSNFEDLIEKIQLERRRDIATLLFILKLCFLTYLLHQVFPCGSWNTMKTPGTLAWILFTEKMTFRKLPLQRTSLRERKDSDPSEGKVQSLRRQTTWETTLLQPNKRKTECLMILMSICFVLRGWTCGYFVKVDSTKMYQDVMFHCFTWLKILFNGWYGWY